MIKRRTMLALLLLIIVISLPSEIIAARRDAVQESNVCIRYTEEVNADILTADWLCRETGREGSWTVFSWPYGSVGFTDQNGQREVFLRLQSVNGKSPRLDYGRGDDQIKESKDELIWSTSWKWSRKTWYSLRLQSEETGGRSYLTLWLKRQDPDNDRYQKLAVFSYNGTLAPLILNKSQHSCMLTAKDSSIFQMRKVYAREKNTREWRRLGDLEVLEENSGGSTQHWTAVLIQRKSVLRLQSGAKSREDMQPIAISLNDRDLPDVNEYLSEGKSELAKNIQKFRLHAPTVLSNYEYYDFADTLQASWRCEENGLDTYWALLHWPFGYCGFQNVQGKHLLLFSVWNLDDGTKPKIEFTRGSKYGVFDHEGVGLQSFMDYPWKTGVWYTMRVQEWREANATYLALWVKEDKGPWELTTIYSYPGDYYFLTDPCSFQEDFTFNNEVRSCRIKDVFARNAFSKIWVPLNHIRIENNYALSDTNEELRLDNIPFNAYYRLSKSGRSLKIHCGGQEDLDILLQAVPKVFILKQKQEPADTSWLTTD
ncbi:MAG: DUF3472 domain-containing protein [Eubacteriales bacterium]|nr:DUF3472 domain-containing protein [Eubacteriales bacterium]